MHDDDTVVRPRAHGPQASPDTDDTLLRSPVGTASDPLGDTVVRAPGQQRSGQQRSGQQPSWQEQSAREPSGRHASDRPAADVVDATPALPSVPEPPRTRVPSIRVGERSYRLDRPLVIGRRPALPRVVRGPEPVLVTVPSPHRQVSSSHLLVHAEGEAAVVDDLRSTNGTVVRPAGAPPYRMPAGASIVALTGTVVEIGDGIAIEVLSPHLRVTPPTDGSPPPPAAPPTPLTGTPRTPRERS